MKGIKTALCGQTNKKNSAVLFKDFFVQHSMKIVWQNNNPVRILQIIVSHINLFVTEEYIIERMLVFFFDI